MSELANLTDLELIDLIDREEDLSLSVLGPKLLELDLSPVVQNKMFERNTYTIKWVRNPTLDLKLRCIQLNPHSVRFLVSKTDTGEVHLEEELQLELVRLAIYMAKVLLELKVVPTEKVLMAMVQRFPNLIIDILKAGIVPSEEILLEVVKNNGNLIEHILKSNIGVSDQILMEAVKNSRFAIEHIRKAGIVPSEELLEEARKRNLEDGIDADEGLNAVAG